MGKDKTPVCVHVWKDVSEEFLRTREVCGFMEDVLRTYDYFAIKQHCVTCHHVRIEEIGRQTKTRKR